jgi:hypothetical protein
MEIVGSVRSEMSMLMSAMTLGRAFVNSSEVIGFYIVGNIETCLGLI